VAASDRYSPSSTQPHYQNVAYGNQQIIALPAKEQIAKNALRKSHHALAFIK